MILPFTANALSATTAQVINGTAPYLTFDGGVTKATTVEGLIGIKLSNGKHYISAANTAYPSAIVDTSSPTNAIELPSATDTFASVMTLVPLPAEGNTTYPTITLNNLVNGSYNYWKDDDGDGTPSITPPSAALTVTWKDVNGKDITSEVKANPDSKVSGCDAPYALTIKAMEGTLSTKYGVPPSSKFEAGTHTYYIKPKIVAPYSCYAKPNLRYGDNNNATGNGQSGKNFAGPTSQWDPAKGFKPQSSGPNFPTTGSHGLSFELTIAGATAQSVIDAMGTTVQATTPTNVSLGLTVVSPNVLKVTLQGPKNGTASGQMAFSASTFKLNSGATEIYNFTISKWFIAQPSVYTQFPAAANFCTALVVPVSYHLALRSDYTNSPYADAINFPPQPGASTGSWTYPGTNNNYTRTIGGGLFAEWGNTAKTETPYTSSDWEDFYYWTSEQWSSSSQYVVYSVTGIVLYYSRSESVHRAACVSSL